MSRRNLTYFCANCGQSALGVGSVEYLAPNQNQRTLNNNLKLVYLQANICVVKSFYYVVKIIFLILKNKLIYLSLKRNVSLIHSESQPQLIIKITHENLWSGDIKYARRQAMTKVALHCSRYVLYCTFQNLKLIEGGSVCINIKYTNKLKMVGI